MRKVSRDGDDALHEEEHGMLLGEQERRKFDGSGSEDEPVTLSSMWRSNRAFFVVMVVVAFSQGLGALSELALQYLLKDDFNQSPSEAAYVITATVQLPWVIKPFYGFFSDSFPVFGYRRVPYLIVFGIISAAALFALATVVDDVTSCIVALGVGSFAAAFVDVLTDALLVENSRGLSQANASFVLAIYWGVQAATACVSGFFGGLLLEYISKRSVFLITAASPLLVSMVAILVHEEPAESQDCGPQLALLTEAFTQRETLPDGSLAMPLWKPTLFLFIWQASPSSYQTMFYFFTNELGFPESFMGVVKLVGCTFSLLAVVLYQVRPPPAHRLSLHRWLAPFTSPAPPEQTSLVRLPIRSVVLWGTAVMVMVGFLLLVLVLRINVDLGISDYVFAIGDRAVMSGVGTLAHYPLMLLAIRLCPKHVEGTMYAAMMSAHNIGGSVSMLLGGLFTDMLDITEYRFDNLWILVLICILTSALPLFFITTLLPASDKDTSHGVAATPRLASPAAEPIPTKE